MLLVVDANIIFSALIKGGATRSTLLLSGIDFFTPEFSIREIKKHLPELQEKAGLSEREISRLLDELLELSEMVVVPFEDFRNREALAKEISPDRDDVAYIALALHLGCTVWSNDAALKRQNRVKIISTGELLSELGNK
ncbi:MAG: PIN domain-containing protein [Candidatus Diapherotrites archaeon]